MIRKRVWIGLLGIGLVLSSCGGTKVQESDKYSKEQKGFLESAGNRMTETPDGYYTLMGDYLAYLDKNLENCTIVCDKANCLHNKEKDEDKISCNAFFGNAKDIKYHNGKLYIYSDALEKDDACALYEVSMDGSEKKKIYKGKSWRGMFTFYGDDVLVYDPYYDSSQGTETLAIVRFPLKNPNKEKEIFQTTEYELAEINNLLCDGEFLYFDIFTTEIYTYRINMDTNEVQRIGEELNSGCSIGKDYIIGRKLLESDWETEYWEDELYLYNKEGEKLRSITEKDFPLLAEHSVIQAVDDDYVYLVTPKVGVYEKPVEQQYINIFTFDGELMGKVPSGDFTISYIPVPGSEDYMIIYDSVMLEVGHEEIYYKVDKSKLGKSDVLYAEEFLRFNTNDYSGYSY